MKPRNRVVAATVTALVFFVASWVGYLPLLDAATKGIDITLVTTRLSDRLVHQGMTSLAFALLGAVMLAAYARRPSVATMLAVSAIALASYAGWLWNLRQQLLRFADAVPSDVMIPLDGVPLYQSAMVPAVAVAAFATLQGLWRRVSASRAVR